MNQASSLRAYTRTKYPVPMVIAIDVDGTLFIKGRLNKALVSWIKEKKAEGFELIIWSSRGTAYANKAADEAGLTGIADAVISKPGYVVDDKGWSWTQHTRVVPGLC